MDLQSTANTRCVLISHKVLPKVHQWKLMGLKSGLRETSRSNIKTSRNVPKNTCQNKLVSMMNVSSQGAIIIGQGRSKKEISRLAGHTPGSFVLR